MREIPPEDEKPKKNWFSASPKPDPKPKPKPKPEPKPKHSAERERRQVKLARNVRSHTPSEPAKKSDDGCGCLVLIGVIVLGIIIAFFV